MDTNLRLRSFEHRVVQSPMASGITKLDSYAGPSQRRDFCHDGINVASRANSDGHRFDIDKLYDETAV
jgi:hypothetical protein